MDNVPHRIHNGCQYELTELCDAHVRVCVGCAAGVSVVKAKIAELEKTYVHTEILDKALNSKTLRMETIRRVVQVVPVEFGPALASLVRLLEGSSARNVSTRGLR